MTDSARFRVYWEDTDGGGVVYHARYLHFFERARSDWLRALGFGQRDLKDRVNRVFAVTRMDTRFIQPARLDDELLVSVVVKAIRAVSMDFVQTMHRAHDHVLLATAEVRAACLAADSFELARPPADLLAAIKQSQTE